MKTKMLYFWLVALTMALGSSCAMAQHGGFHGGGQFHGGGGFHGSGGFHGGPHGGRFHDFRGRGLVIVGGPFFWAPYFYDGGVYPNNDLYVEPGVDYGYYCGNPAGYYPYIARCPTGWLRVTPDPY